MKGVRDGASAAPYGVAGFGFGEDASGEGAGWDLIRCKL